MNTLTFNIHQAIEENKVADMMIRTYMADKVEEVFPHLAHHVNPKKEQNPKYHEFDVYFHEIAVAGAVEVHHPKHPILYPAALTHDCGKALPEVRSVNKEGQPNDIGHEKAGVEPAREYLEREGFDQETIRKVLLLVEYHGITLTNNSDEDAETEVEATKDKTIRKALNKIKTVSLGEEDFYDNLWLLFEFKKMDALAFNTKNGFSQKQYKICELMYPRFKELAKELF